MILNWHSWLPTVRSPSCAPGRQKDAKRTNGPDRSPIQDRETSESSDFMTRATSRAQNQPQWQMSVHGLRAGRTDDITSRFSKDRGRCPRASRTPDDKARALTEGLRTTASHRSPVRCENFPCIQILFRERNLEKLSISQKQSG